MQQEHKDTLILERFEAQYGGDRAVDLTTEFGTEVIEGAWIDPSNVVSIMHESIEKVGPMSISGLQSHTIDWEQIESKEGTELLKLYSEDTTTSIATEYVTMVCDLFEVDTEVFIENTKINGSYDEWPIVYDDEDTNLVVVIAPYITN